MKYLIDTNIFLEIILEQDKAQESMNLLELSNTDNFYMSDFSLHSIGIILFNRKQYLEFDNFIDDIISNLGIQVLFIQKEEFKLVTKNSNQFNLDFDDSYQYTLSNLFELNIISYDKDFDKTRKGRILPSDFLKKDEIR